MPQGTQPDNRPTPPVPPAADLDDARTLRRLMWIAATAMAAGLAFLAVCIYVVVRDGG